jgi:SAM-dependent methyltransferase
MGAEVCFLTEAALGEHLVAGGAERPAARMPAVEAHRIWSRTYDDDPNPVLALELRVLGGLLGPIDGLRVVDVACGTGRSMAFAALHGASAIGIDLCPEMLAVAARKPGLSGRLAQAHGGRLPLGDAVADLAICSFALSYFPSPSEAIGELARIARPGGRVAISDLHPRALKAGWKRSFRSGRETYEIEYRNHRANMVETAAEQGNLRLDLQIDAHFGPAERDIFRTAGKEADFSRLCRIPAVRILLWVKR